MKSDGRKVLLSRRGARFVGVFDEEPENSREIRQRQTEDQHCNKTATVICSSIKPSWVFRFLKLRESRTIVSECCGGR